jgi:hypothetical protein
LAQALLARSALAASPQGNSFPADPKRRTGPLAAGDPPSAIRAGELCAVYSHPAATFSLQPQDQSLTHRLVLTPLLVRGGFGHPGGFQRLDTRYISWYSPPPESPAAPAPAALREKNIESPPRQLLPQQLPCIGRLSSGTRTKVHPVVNRTLHAACRLACVQDTITVLNRGSVVKATAFR